jgi:hypothetical protein
MKTEILRVLLTDLVGRSSADVDGRVTRYVAGLMQKHGITALGAVMISLL